MASSTMAGFLHLPDEIVHCTLALLRPKDIRRCQQVCRTFNAVITTSPYLLYILTLDSLGHAPPSVPRPDLKSAECLELLHQHRLHWSRPYTIQPTRYELRPSTCDVPSKYVGGVYVQGAQANGLLGSSGVARSLRFYQLPSKNLGVGFSEWHLDDLRVDTKDYTIDPDQDLLVLLELPADTAPLGLCKIHLRTMSTNQSHPRAQVPAMTANFSQYGVLEVPDWSFDFKVFGQLVAILFRSRSREIASWVVVWDWNRGIEVTRVPTVGGWHASFTLLSPTTLLLPRFSESFHKRNYIPNDLFGSLNVYTFDPYASSSTPPSLITSFALPKLGRDYIGSIIKIRCSSNVLYTETQSPGRPKVYEPTSEGRLIGIDVHVCQSAGFSQVIEHAGTLYIPSSVFLEQSHQTKGSSILQNLLMAIRISPLENTQIPWCKWAHHTFWVNPGDPTTEKGCPMHGDRMGAFSSRLGMIDPPSEISIIDFNQRRIRWEERLGTSACHAWGGGKSPVWKDPLEEVFCDIGSSGRMKQVRTTLKVEEGIGLLDSVLLDDEHVVIIQKAGSGRGSSLLVYNF